MLSPAMFEEFFLEPYKRVYGFWKANGAEVIIHHSDSYAAELVPFMIEMGVETYFKAPRRRTIFRRCFENTAAKSLSTVVWITASSTSRTGPSMP
jgi:hypothetical protein